MRAVWGICSYGHPLLGLAIWSDVGERAKIGVGGKFPSTSEIMNHKAKMMEARLDGLSIDAKRAHEVSLQLEVGITVKTGK